MSVPRVFFRGVGKVGLGVEHSKMNRTPIERIPHVQYSVTRVRRHIESSVVSCEVAQLMLSFRVDVAVEGVALRFMVTLM